MKASEIVDKLKSVLLSAEETQAEEQVELSVEEVEVPAEELSKEEEKVDLSAEEPAAEPIAHSPEVESAPKANFFKSAKPRNTMSVVYEKMFNK